MRKHLSPGTTHIFTGGTNFEHVKEHLLQHQRISNKTLYRVRRYGFDADDDTLDPESQTPAYFVTRYCR